MENVNCREETVKRIIRFFPRRMEVEILGVAIAVKNFFQRVREIRIRPGGHTCAVMDDGIVPFCEFPTKGELDGILMKLCDNALYAHRDAIGRGYVSLPDGVRVGVGGRASYEGGSLVGIGDVSSLVFRIPSESPQAEEALYLAWQRAEGGNLLIAAPAAGGQTTALRSLAVAVAKRRPELCTVVVDDRGEISSFLRPLGVDVLSGYERARGIEVAYRTLSAKLILVDEIATEKEAEAVLYALGSGSAMVATCHADSLSSLYRRKCLSALLSSGMFHRAAFLKLSRLDLCVQEEELLGVEAC